MSFPISHFPFRPASFSGLLLCARLVVASALAGTLAQAQAPPAAGTGLIVGQVIDAASGNPLTGAIVSLVGGSIPATSTPPPELRGNVPRVLTGPDGRFVFRDLAPGSYNIAATKSGYADGAYGRRRPGGPALQVRLRDGEAAGDVTVRMWRYGAISGTVVDEAGEPLVGVRMSALRRIITAGNRRLGARINTTTDDRGAYRFGTLIPGEYVVGMIARPSGMRASMANRFRASLAPPPIVEDGDMAYVLGRGVPVPPPPAGGRMFVYPNAFFPAGSAQPGLVTVGSGEERTGIDLQLQPAPAVRVSGVVVDAEGPPGGIALMLVPLPFGEVPFDEEVIMTEEDGSFIVPAVTPGEYSIRVVAGDARARAGRWGNVPVTVGSTHVDGVVVALQPGLRISGRLEFEGAGERPSPQRLQQVQISIEPAEIPSVLVRQPPRADPTGTFTSIPLQPARYFVRIRDSPTGWMFKSATYNGRNVADVPLDLQGGDATNVIITFTDRWTGFRGMVQTAAGLPNDEAAVLLFPADSQAWRNYGVNPRRLKSARTTKTGEYSFTSVPAGDYYVVALPDEQTADWQDPQFLEALARVATPMSIEDGEQKVLNLRMQTVR